MTKNRTLALALTLSLSLLSACGGGQTQQPDVSAAASSSAVSIPDASSAQEAAPSPDSSVPDSSDQQVISADLPTTLTLDKTDFTLFKAGDSYRLRYTMEPDCDGIPEFSSSDESVAAVSEDGTVTAVAPGSAVITLEYGGLTAVCTVRCKFEAATTSSGTDSVSGDTASSGGSTPSTPAVSAPASVDLVAFYTTLAGKYEFPSFMALADDEVTDAFYAGLTGISTQQRLVYANLMSMNMGELVLVQVTDSKDVSAVKAILQSRVDYMVEGGAWYPEPTELWQNSARVVSNGNYILMVVNASCDAIVSDFNALF